MKKIFAVLVAVCLILSTAGCRQDDVSTEQDSIENAEIKTIEPPENGWTLEELNKVLYLNGQQIQLPLMFSTLKNGYEIKEKEYYENSDRASGVLYYNDQFIAIISFYDLDDDYKITTLCFSPSYYEDKYDYSNYFIVNGFGLKDNTLNIQNSLGDKFTKDNGFYKYILANNEYTILVTDVEENYMIMLFEGVNTTEIQ